MPKKRENINYADSNPKERIELYLLLIKQTIY